MPKDFAIANWRQEVNIIIILRKKSIAKRIRLCGDLQNAEKAYKMGKHCIIKKFNTCFRRNGPLWRLYIGGMRMATKSITLLKKNYFMFFI